MQDDGIDVSGINALVFTELTNYMEQIKIGSMFGSPVWSYILSDGNIFLQILLKIIGGVLGFCFRWLVFPVIAWILLHYGYQSLGIFVLGVWGLYLFYRLVTLPSRWRFKRDRRKAVDKANEILAAMAAIWHSARAQTINPRRLKELVVAAEDKGAVFRPLLHTLIDRAIERDPTALVRPKV